MPLVFLGPGVEELNLGGRWSEADIAPTLLDLLNISPGLSGEETVMPVADSFELLVTGAPSGLARGRVRRGWPKEAAASASSGAYRAGFLHAESWGEGVDGDGQRG